MGLACRSNLAWPARFRWNIQSSPGPDEGSIYRPQRAAGIDGDLKICGIVDRDLVLKGRVETSTRIRAHLFKEKVAQDAERLLCHFLRESLATNCYPERVRDLVPEGRGYEEYHPGLIDGSVPQRDEIRGVFPG